MSYQKDRDDFVARMAAEDLPTDVTRQLLAGATTLQRLAELACSSEAADRDRVPCPQSAAWRGAKGLPCLCDSPEDHQDIPRITLQEWRTEQRLSKAMPAGWTIATEGDPRGLVLRVIPPSYAALNAGRDRHNLDTIGVPVR
jgi:hypothetical protein